jgi:hypothetical protein
LLIINELPGREEEEKVRRAEKPVPSKGISRFSTG